MASRAYTPDRLAEDLRKAQRATDKQVASANRQIGREARGHLRDAAQAGTPIQRHMAGGIGTRASKNAVLITVKNTKAAPGAQGAFWGVKRWAQFLEWVGASWPVASRSGGPYVINAALAEKQPDYEAAYLDNVFGKLPGR